ncbi:MAG: CBS domain-containing protein [Gammaproteobacteria bacterium]|nr:CBS domain-containing protein [Gammaproteobacteria bacterium]
MKIGALCRQQYQVVEVETSVAEASQRMNDAHIHEVIVVRRSEMGNIPIGTLTDHDITAELADEEVDLREISVRDVMSFNILLAYDFEDSSTIIERMRADGIHRLPVVDKNDVLLGVVSLNDLVNIPAESGKDLSTMLSHPHEGQANQSLN